MPLAFAPERIETWPLARLQPYAKNAKVHGADQVAKIAASMAEFGWTVPCYAAVSALALNLVVSWIVTLILRAASVAPTHDETVAGDYV